MVTNVRPFKGTVIYWSVQGIKTLQIKEFLINRDCNQ